MSDKPTNPKDAVGCRKAPLSVLPWPVIYEVGSALFEGARKYGRHNYRAIGVRGSVYFDGAMRHLAAWWEGQDIDPDSGLSHISKAIAGLMVLRDGMMQENWTDDRPPVSRDGWLDDINTRTEELLERYPEAKEPFTNQG